MRALLVALLTAASPAGAQTSDAIMSALRGTLSVTAQPNLTGGKITGCSLVFDALYQDWTYRQGQYLKVSGSVGLMFTNAQVGAVLKVVVHEVDASGPPFTFTPSPPSRAYILDSSMATNLPSLVKATETDTPGALFSIFQVSPTLEMVVDAFQHNRLTIAFNSRHGDTDMQVPIELDVVNVSNTGQRERSAKARDDFVACINQIKS